MAVQQQTQPIPEIQERPKNLFVLVTQCLQNSFFLEADCQLCLPSRVVEQMLLGAGGELQDTNRTASSVRHFPTGLLRAGPLYRFLDTVINSRSREDPLHIINIKDWHDRSPNYDQERRVYGTHCEADTYGAECIDGFEVLLEPWKTLANRTAASDAHLKALEPEGYQHEINFYHEVRSDTLFDFQAKERGEDSRLKAIFDNLLEQAEREDRRLYVIVIGAYTDIKIMTLLTSLRSLYQLDNLITSDVLTAAPTLERHLAGLDYCDKVLKVEIIHSLNDLAALFAPKPSQRIDSAITSGHPDFRHYRSYYHDKQNVLSYQDDKLAQYVDLAGRRSAKVYQWIYVVNLGLMLFGFMFLILAFISAILHLSDPQKFPAELVLLTGGLSISQLLMAFFAVPSRDMQNNLYSLVRLRNYLEAYSTITALLRHYFTRPELLQMPGGDPKVMLDLLKKQIEIFDMFAGQMNQNFGSISGENVSTEAAEKQPGKTQTGTAPVGGMAAPAPPSAENSASGQPETGSPTSAG